jgi:hypothetical protein
MLLKVNGEFLDFNGNIEIEKQSKLFEEIDTTSGDFSYSFSLPKTTKNLSVFDFPFADVSSKTIYQNVLCDILDNDGLTLYTGQLRVQRVRKKTIECAFFSGNYNWISSLTGSVSDLDFSEYDIELTDSNIINSTVNTSGLVFPLMDIGALKTRSYQSLMVEDFNGCMYVKTIFNKIFFSNGFKIKGDLLNDYVYQNAIIATNNKSSEGIESRSSYAKKTSNQTVVDSTAYAVVLFQDDSTFPYFDGDSNNYNTGTYRYTADVKMSVKVEVNLVISMNTQLNRQWYRINKNGSTFREYVNRFGPGASPPTNYSFVVTMLLDAGDYIEIDIKSVDSIGINTGVQTGSTFKVTPIYIYTVLGGSTVPKWTKQQFVSNILNQFNVVTDYNPISKEITFNLVDRINTKEAIDISPYVANIEIDFEEFISSFGKNNILSYQSSDSEDSKEYNVENKLPYGSGVIEVDNDFIEEEVDIIQSDFTAPTSYINGAIDASLELAEFIELEEGDETDFLAVADSVGFAEFTVDDDFFSIGDLVRVSESTNAGYNGDYVVSNGGGGQLFLQGIDYNVNASGKITKLNYKYNNSDSVYLLINIPNATLSHYSGAQFIELDLSQYTNYTYCYFNLLNTNRTINTNYKQGLSFGTINDPLFYQKTLLETYWRATEKILSDPVKLIVEAYFPKSVFLSLTPLTPVFIKSNETVNQYYINRISGYINSYMPCEVELIKL